MDNGLMTPQQVADMLQISIHTLASWRRAGSEHDLPWIEVGGSVRYRREDVDAWLTKRTKVSEKERAQNAGE